MPVLSPHHTSSTYRSSYSSTSTLDRPSLYSSSSYNPRISSFSERYTTRSSTDSDGRRTILRSGSITEDGLTTRFREEIRDGSIRRDSLSKDSGISSIRENSILDFTRRDSSLTREGSLKPSSLDVIDDLAELRSKYSPMNYVPAIHRRNENISRSKSINDIGLPPIEKNKKKVNDGVNHNNASALPNNTTNNDNYSSDDTNGNRASVADLRKKFDQPEVKVITIEIERSKSSENKLKNLEQKNGTKFPLKKMSVKKRGEEVEIKKKIKEESNKLIKKQMPGVHSTLASEIRTKSSGSLEKSKVTDDKSDNESDKSKSIVKINSDKSCSNGLVNGKLEVKSNEGSSDKAAENEGQVLNGGASNQENTGLPSRVSNFASYIPTKNLERGDKVVCEENLENEIEPDDFRDRRTNDLTSSPKLNSRAASTSVSPSLGGAREQSTSPASNSLGRRSVERDRRAVSSVFTDSDDSYNTYKSTNALSTRTLGLNGLKNIGNTCFMNSVIQCLSNTQPLLEYLRKDQHVRDINTTISGMKGSLIKAFAEVIKELWSEDSADHVVNTVSLKSQIQRFAPRFMGYAQQDAQEFLRYLLEGLHEDVNRVTEKPKPILTEIDDKLNDVEKSAESWNRYLRMDNSRIVDIFVGQLKSTLKCTFCGHCSVTFDPFWDLSLPIPQRTGQLRLAQCLESFTREETLDGDEKPTCSKCKERQKCTKSFSIQKFPKILVIHLKRFSPNERFRGKLNVTVDFPLEGLDMSKYAADGVLTNKYNLYAVSNHSGTTYSGHYTAYCRHPYNQQWHEYNDSRVSSVSSRSVVSSEAYVLFYEQEGQRAHL